MVEEMTKKKNAFEFTMEVCKQQGKTNLVSRNRL